MMLAFACMPVCKRPASARRQRRARVARPKGSAIDWTIVIAAHGTDQCMHMWHTTGHSILAPLSTRHASRTCTSRARLPRAAMHACVRTGQQVSNAA